MYRVFEFDEFTPQQLENELNKYAEEGYVATFTDMKRERGLLSGTCIMHQFIDPPEVPQLEVFGFSACKQKS